MSSLSPAVPSPHDARGSRRIIAGLLVLAAMTPGCAARERLSAQDAPAARLMPARERLASASPELRGRLAASPIAFFRFVNAQWTREVCRAFAGDLGALPMVRLHGDAHVEQYAVTATARGLDDFDDAARGPAAVDIVRFLGSLELTARDRGWGASVPALADAFFDGYWRAHMDPAYLPGEPAIVTRLRAQPVRSPGRFLSWVDALMQPLAADDRALVDAAWIRVEMHAAEADAAFTPAFLRRKQMGALHLGIGSALARKVLIRVEGPSPADDDDVVLEAKEVASLRGQPCLSIPSSGEVFRIIEGVRQIGRLEHRLLVALPSSGGDGHGASDWWVKTWERSYREVEIADLASAEELGQIAHDVGAQLGSTNVLESPRGPAGSGRAIDADRSTTPEPRLRQAAHELTRALLEAWHRFRTQ